jgi:hypothetical protein
MADVFCTEEELSLGCDPESLGTISRGDRCDRISEIPIRNGDVLLVNEAHLMYSRID